jgi:hypothetical protein
VRWPIPILIACGGSDKASGSTDSQKWTGGDFDFYTRSVDDDCLGGAMEALFMTEGPSAPHPFEYAIYQPDSAQLPYSSTVDLRDPFVEMPVTIEDGGRGGFKIRGAVMEPVVLGSAAYGDCTVTVTVDAGLGLIDVETLGGNDSISLSGPRGDDAQCPVFNSDECSVALTISAVRK